MLIRSSSPRSTRYTHTPRASCRAVTALLVCSTFVTFERTLTLPFVLDQTFAGSLLSAVTCSSCRTTSTTVDPILDIQLDFPISSSTSETLTLAGMLRRFCAEERVGDMGKGYECSSCGGGAGVVGQIRRVRETITNWKHRSRRENCRSRNLRPSCRSS